MSTVACLPDNRQVGYCVVGKGYPVLYFHGTASSRLEVILLKRFAETYGLSIVGVDRPGYGLSTYYPRKRLVDFNPNINALMDLLGFERFAILGWSGGGTFALAYLAQNPKRVTKAVVASSPSLPFDVSTAHNLPFAQYLMKLPFVGTFAMRQLRRQVLKANNNLPAFLASRQGKQMLSGYSKSDLSFFSNPDWATLMYQSMAEAFRQSSGVRAVVEEHQLFMKPWDFSFAAIPSGRLSIWQGTEDKTCRVNNAYELHRSIPGSKLRIFPGKGHCVIFNYQEQLAQALLE